MASVVEWLLAKSSGYENALRSHVGSSGWARSLFGEVHSAQATCAGCAFFRFAWRTQVPCKNGELGPGKISLVSEPANNSRVFKRKGGSGVYYQR